MSSFTLPPLPYAMDALAPHISRETLEYHYGKHHQTYVNNLNKLVPGTEFEHKTLEEIIKKATGGLFNSSLEPYILLALASTTRWRRAHRQTSRSHQCYLWLIRTISRIIYHHSTNHLWFWLGLAR